MGLIYNFMKSNFDDFKNNLSSKEQSEYKKYLTEIQSKLGKDFIYIKPEENIPTHPAMQIEM
jgi:predicted secreted acid phosphatase